MTRPLKYALPLFFFLSLAILLTAWGIIHSQHYVTNPSSLSFGITFDICLLIPLVYFLCIRKTNISKLSLIPVFIIALQLAGWILPQQEHQWINRLELLLIPIEIGIVGFVIHKINKGLKAFKSSRKEDTDTLLHIKQVVAQESGSKRFGNIFGSEVAIFYYLLFAQKEQLPTAASIQTFSYHKRIAYPATVAIFILIILAETFALHLLLLRWHPLPAWIATISSIYAIFFLLADLRAVLHRPIYIANQHLWIRIGLRWYFKVALEDIEMIKATQKSSDYQEVQKMVLFGDPNLLIQFKSEQKAEGMYGIKRRFHALGLQVDDPKQLIGTIKGG